MTEQLEIRIPLADLKKMVIECPRCHAETTLDIADPNHRTLKQDPNKHGFFCTVCTTSYDSQLRNAVLSAFAMYDAAEAAQLTEFVSFRVKKT